MMYAKTKTEFDMCQESFHSDGISTLYPTFKYNIQKLYSYRVETWTLYSKMERQLPTRGPNTNSYCEASMRTKKENQ